MILLLLLPVAALAILCILPRDTTAIRWNKARGRVSRSLRYRFQRVKLPDDWWEQFERDFAAYVDPHAVRARHRERS